MTTIQWADEPKDHNYPAAISFLSLVYTPEAAEVYVERLKEAEMTAFKAKDIFRASGLAKLGEDNWHVKDNIKKITGGHKLSPILLVRDTEHGKVVIADGYHRMCAVYQFDEDAIIHCKIV